MPISLKLWAYTSWKKQQHLWDVNISGPSSNFTDKSMWSHRWRSIRNRLVCSLCEGDAAASSSSLWTWNNAAWWQCGLTLTWLVSSWWFLLICVCSENKEMFGENTFFMCETGHILKESGFSGKYQTDRSALLLLPPTIFHSALTATGNTLAAALGRHALGWEI